MIGMQIVFFLLCFLFFFGHYNFPVLNFICSNNVSDISQVEFLCLCSSLRILTLEGNPICSAPNLEASSEVKKTLVLGMDCDYLSFKANISCFLKS